MPERLAMLVIVALLVAACGGEPAAETIEVGSGAESPELAVEGLFALLSDGEFGQAASLAVPGQAALASLAEGAPVAEVATALRDGDAVVASNFWSGFAQSVDELIVGGVDPMGTTTTSTEGVDFVVVDVGTPGGDVRHITTRDIDGYRIDIFATFGPALAGRLYPQVELLFESPSEDASLILGGLREQVPSLYVASQTPELAPNVVQDILQLIELITRVN